MDTTNLKIFLTSTIYNQSEFYVFAAGIRLAYQQGLVSERLYAKRLSELYRIADQKNWLTCPKVPDVYIRAFA